MNRLSHRTGWAGVATSAVLVVLGFAAVWLVKCVLNIDSNAVYVTALLLPTAAYLALSGKLTAIKGPGGLEAKFVVESQKTVDATTNLVTGEDLQLVAKGDPALLRAKIDYFDRSRPTVLTLTLGNATYDQSAVLASVETMEELRNFKGLVVVDGEERFVGFVWAWRAKAILRSPVANSFVGYIRSGQRENVRNFPGVIKDTILVDETNLKALQTMAAQSLKTLVVSAPDGKFRGVVEWHQVLNKLVLALAG